MVLHGVVTRHVDHDWNTPVTSVFTYGTLMFEEIWQLIAGRPYHTVKAVLPGYQRFKMKHAEYPGITPAGQDHCVTGLIYLNIHERVVAALDGFEDDHYSQKPVTAITSAGIAVSCLAWVIPAVRRNRLSETEWHADDFERNHLQEFVTAYRRLVKPAGRVAATADKV